MRLYGEGKSCLLKGCSKNGSQMQGKVCTDFKTATGSNGGRTKTFLSAFHDVEKSKRDEA